MLTTAKQTDRFANRIDQTLRSDERSTTSMRVVTGCHFNVALVECGFRRRGEKNVALIEAALARRQVYASPSLTDPTVQFDQLVHFSRTPLDPTRPAQRRLRFPVERDFESFVVENFGYLFEHLRTPKRQYELPSGNKIDILARDRASGDYVVMELKRASQDRGTPSQIVGYMEELEAHERAQGRQKPRGVRGLVLTSERNEMLTGHVAALAEHHHYQIEWLVCRVEMALELAVTPQQGLALATPIAIHRVPGTIVSAPWSGGI